MAKLTPRERFLNIFEDKPVDRVPTFVQGIKGGFIQKYEEDLFNNFDGELIFNPEFDAAIVLGFDAKFAHLPGATCAQIEIELEFGRKAKI
ncbi:MAG: hypothetical protein ACTSRZ_15045 [Promethearchaeota archaeon]